MVKGWTLSPLPRDDIHPNQYPRSFLINVEIKIFGENKNTPFGVRGSPQTRQNDNNTIPQRAYARPENLGNGMSPLNSRTRILAVIDLVLILPAVLFLAAVGVRAFQPVQLEPAHTAQIIVDWYAGKVWTLWVLLVSLPLLALVLGCASLAWNRIDPKQSQTPHWNNATIVIAAEILAAFVILVVVALHILAN